MRKLKVATIEQILGHELKILGRIEAGVAVPEDFDLLRHYEKRRKDFYSKFENRYKGVKQ